MNENIHKKKTENNKKVPLKVNRYTTVMVSEEKNTPEYAAKLRARFNASFSSRTSLKDL